MKKALVLILVLLFVLGNVMSEEVILPVIDGKPMVILPSKAINPGNNKDRYNRIYFNENNVKSTDALGEVTAKPISQNFETIVFSDIGDGIIVKEIKTETIAIYLNEDDYGRILTTTELKKVTISATKKDDGNFDLIMTKVPKGTYRINIDIVVNFSGIDYLITLQFNDDKLLPTKGAKELPSVVENTEPIQASVVPVTEIVGNPLLQ